MTHAPAIKKGDDREKNPYELSSVIINRDNARHRVLDRTSDVGGGGVFAPHPLNSRVIDVPVKHTSNRPLFAGKLWYGNHVRSRGFS